MRADLFVFDLADFDCFAAVIQCSALFQLYA
jgi:hypothetical protein